MAALALALRVLYSAGVLTVETPVLVLAAVPPCSSASFPFSRNGVQSIGLSWLGWWREDQSTAAPWTSAAARAASARATPTTVAACTTGSIAAFSGGFLPQGLAVPWPGWLLGRWRHIAHAV
jgi:hypothetical protein